MLETAGLPPIDSAGYQVVHVRVDAGYWPRSIVARAGTPTRIIFQRADRDECSSRVVFSSPRLERRLTPNGQTTVDLPARPSGEIRFTCGMGRYRGRIRFVDERRRAILARWREQAPRLEAPLGTTRPRWLLPGLVVGIVLAGLVLAGAVSLSLVVYAGLFGGMILMHLGGHGGHGSHGGPETHQGHEGGTTPDAEDLSRRSDRSQPGRPGSDEAPDRASINPNGNERHDHDQHGSHGCH